MRLLKKRIRRFLDHLVYGYRADSESYLRYLRELGMRIGEGTTLFSSKTVIIDEQKPQMIIIGRNVQITRGVIILSHDYGWAVTKAVYDDVLGSVRPVTIGDNVYIGMNAIILAGSRIGNNVIIGANSTVTGIIPDNCVAVGSPCREIYSIEEYHEKRKKAQLSEAVEIARQYFDCYGQYPPKDIFAEYFWLWTKNREDLTEHFTYQNNLILGSEMKTWEKFENHTPIFSSYQDFLDYVFKNSRDQHKIPFDRKLMS